MGVGIGVGIGVEVGVATGVGLGVAVAVAVGFGFGLAIETPLFQTNFLFTRTQVCRTDLKTFTCQSFEQLEPGLGAAALAGLVIRGVSNVVKRTRVISCPKVF